MSGPRELRRDARALLDAAVAAVEPEALIADALEREVGLASGRVHLVAIGKAAAAMSRGAVSVLSERLERGVVVLPEAHLDEVPAGLKAYGGGHPVPNAAGQRGGEAILRLASSLGSTDTLLVLISGGGSALATLPPPGVPLAAVQETTRLLLRAGATIEQLNAVRKHLDQLKGGRLARAAAPAKVSALILSDVVGDPLDVIASGPVSPDPSTFAEVANTLNSFDLWQRLPTSVRRHLQAGLDGETAESPSLGDACFDQVDVRIVGNNRRAAEAALAKAAELGYQTVLLTTSMTGEARQAGGFLAALAREVRRSGQPLAPPACLLAAGETTVTVVGEGLGGRNQELALGAAFGLAGEEGVLIAGFGTDGIDGPTDAAGAWVDGETTARARAAGLDPQDFLRRNDAYRLFEALEDLILTGPTGTNVMDLSLVLIA